MTMKFIFAVALCALGAYVVSGKMCPGGGQSCEQHMTCCELPSGRQGCCPYENATCCADKVHCCPSGYHCKTDRCDKEDEDEIMTLKKLMVYYDNEAGSVDESGSLKDEVIEAYHFTNGSNDPVICPDGEQCPDGSTCCLVSARPKRYGCCPLDGAVCCRDMQHCCPQGTRCISQGKCIGIENDVVNFKATPVNTICPGGRETCPAGNTCCPTSLGHFGCCPLLAATCCNDGLHCCPHDYQCDGRGYCTKLN